MAPPTSHSTCTKPTTVCKLTAGLLLVSAIFSAIPACRGDSQPLPATHSENGLISQPEEQLAAKEKAGVVTDFGPLKEGADRQLPRKLAGDGLGSNCFPADARVTTSLAGQTKLLSDLCAGDEVVGLDVATGQLKVEQVLSNDLRGIDVMAEHVTLGTASGHVITATPDHQIFASPSNRRDAVSAPLDYLRTAKIVPTAHVQVGDVIWVNKPLAEGSPLSPMLVTSIIRGTKRGMLNPVTPSGTLLVNGFLVTTYTTQAAERMPVPLSQAF